MRTSPDRETMGGSSVGSVSSTLLEQRKVFLCFVIFARLESALCNNPGCHAFVIMYAEPISTSKNTHGKVRPGVAFMTPSVSERICSRVGCLHMLGMECTCMLNKSNGYYNVNVISVDKVTVYYGTVLYIYTVQYPYNIGTVPC